MKPVLNMILGLGLIVGSGCAENPVGHDENDSEYVAEVSVSEEHISTLSETEFEITLHKENGSSLGDISALRIEFRMEDDADGEWEPAEMVHHGSHFEASHMFMSSGEYQWRIVGDEHGDGDSHMLFESDDHMDVERAHLDAGGYRVEFESFPGHVHEGMTATVAFWVFDDDDDGGDGHGGGHGDDHGSDDHGGMTGLDVTIQCDEADGHMEQHQGHEGEPGMYTAEHEFEEHGEVELSIRFHQQGGSEVEAAFHVPVASAH